MTTVSHLFYSVEVVWIIFFIRELLKLYWFSKFCTSCLFMYHVNIFMHVWECGHFCLLFYSVMRDVLTFLIAIIIVLVVHSLHRIMQNIIPPPPPSSGRVLCKGNRLKKTWCQGHSCYWWMEWFRWRQVQPSGEQPLCQSQIHCSCYRVPA